MKLFFIESAKKDLDKLSLDVKKRIIDKLSFFISQENPLIFAKPMVDNDFGQYRFRIGYYRAIFDLKKDQIIILVIGHRKDIYR